MMWLFPSLCIDMGGRVSSVGPGGVQQIHPHKPTRYLDARASGTRKVLHVYGYLFYVSGAGQKEY